MRAAAMTGVVLLMLGLAAAARMTPASVQLALKEQAFESPFGGDEAITTLALLKTAIERRKDSDDKERAYSTIRFTVPPSAAVAFEKAWRDLEEDTLDKDDPIMFALQKTRTDNLFYFGYAEFESTRDLKDHLQSRHFERFTEGADDLDIRWKLEFLEATSADLDEEKEEERARGRKGQDGQAGGGDWDGNIPEEYRKYVPEQYRPSKQHKKGRRDVSELSKSSLAGLGPNPTIQAQDQLRQQLMRRKEGVAVLISYFVPPEERERFEDNWFESAEATIEERGNRAYSLRKVATDNSRYYAYGSWDSKADLEDHFNSKHVQRLLDDVDKGDVVYFASPLISIGEERN